jgi:hypothetical protein
VQGICQGCGEHGTLSPDSVCLTCLIGPEGKVPQLPARPIEGPEVDGLLERLKFRILNGSEKYQGSYLQADLRADLEEELLDAAAYHLLMISRIRKVLLEFVGPTSNELKRR